MPLKKTDITVLVVDDETILLDTLRGLLEAEGYRVRTAASGAAAIEACAAGPVSIVFLDVNMPDLDGLETYRSLLRVAPGVPVVMITGYGVSLRRLIEEALQLGVRGCIDKPFKIAQITGAIRANLPHAD
jgi:CheY-like chemotaxis protein